MIENIKNLSNIIDHNSLSDVKSKTYDLVFQKDSKRVERMKSNDMRLMNKKQISKDSIMKVILELNNDVNNSSSNDKSTANANIYSYNKNLNNLRKNDKFNNQNIHKYEDDSNSRDLLQLTRNFNKKKLWKIYHKC